MTRTLISDRRRTHSFSERASKADLSVIRKHCFNCYHHKAFANLSNQIKCTRCKQVLN